MPSSGLLPVLAGRLVWLMGILGRDEIIDLLDSRDLHAKVRSFLFLLDDDDDFLHVSECVYTHDDVLV